MTKYSASNISHLIKKSMKNEITLSILIPLKIDLHKIISIETIKLEKCWVNLRGIFCLKFWDPDNAQKLLCLFTFHKNFWDIYITRWIPALLIYFLGGKNYKQYLKTAIHLVFYPSKWSSTHVPNTVKIRKQVQSGQKCSEKCSRLWSCKS